MIIYGGFLKWGYPQIIRFCWDFHCKPSIFGYQHFWKLLCVYGYISQIGFIHPYKVHETHICVGEIIIILNFSYGF